MLNRLDITEGVKLEEQMHRQERLASLGKLVAGVAHEIRNPLTSISGYIEYPCSALVSCSMASLGLIIPLAITCVISAYTSRALTSETLYTAKLIQLGLDVFNARRSDILKNILVQDALVTTVETLPAGMPVGRAYKRASSKSFESFPVINHQGALVGFDRATGFSLPLC